MPRPSIAPLRKSSANMVSGMQMASMRTVICQPRKLNGRPIFSPAPISEMITISSVAFSIRIGVSAG